MFGHHSKESHILGLRMAAMGGPALRAEQFRVTLTRVMGSEDAHSHSWGSRH